MKWFKFYGQDWLTDLKIMQMSMEDRLCYITLMCLASSSEESGLIRNCTEDVIISLSRIPDWYEEIGGDNPLEAAKGVFGRLIKIGMITNDNADNVTVVNFAKRQDTNLTNYERVKRHREKQRMARNKALLDDNGDNVINDNDRIEEKRIEYINTGEQTNKEKNKMYNYEQIDSDGNPLKKRMSKIDKATNEMLISVGFLWQSMASESLKIPKKDVVMLNLYYPIRKCYDIQKWSKDEFGRLFKYFLNDEGIKYEDKLSFDLCLSQKYIAKYKLNQKKRSMNETNVSASNLLRL